MALPKVGVEAVVENANGYLKSIGAIVDANKEAADSVKDTAKDFDVLNDTTEYARSVQKRYSDSLKAARSALDDTGGSANFFKEKIAAAAVAVDLSIGIFKAVGSAISFVGEIIGGVIKNVVALGTSIFNSGVDFSKIMANIQSVTKQSAEETRALANELILLGMESIAGPTAVADAYYDISSGVQSAGAQMAILKLAIATAEAGQADLKDTTQGLVTVFNAYKYGIAEITIASDVLSRTTELGTKTLQEYVTAISPIAGLAASSRVKFDELGAAMAFMTQKGLSAGQAGTALQGIMTQLARKTPGVTRALAAMGEKSVEGSIATHGLAGTLKLLTQGAAKTGQNLQQLVGRVEAMKAVTFLGTEEFEKYFKTFTEGMDEATSRQREIQRLDVSAQLQLVKARFEGISLLLAQTVLPSVAKFLKFVNDGLAKLDWKKISAGLDKVAESLGKTVGSLVEKLGSALEDVDWDQVAVDVERVFTQISDFIAGIDWNSIIAGIQGFVAGVQGFFTNLGTQVEGTSNFIQQAVEFIKGIFNGMFVIADGIGALLAAGIENGKTLVEGAVQHIKDGVNGIWMSLFGPEGTITTLTNETWPNIVASIEGAVESVKGALQGVVDGATTTWTSLTTGIETGINTAWINVTTSINNALMPIQDAINGIVATVQAIWDGMTSDITGKILAAWLEVQRIVETAKADVKRVFDAVAKVVMDALKPAVDFIVNLGTSIKNIGDALANLGIGGGGGGGVPGGARGGHLKEGINIVGERGVEAIVKHGKTATVISHQKTKGIMKGMGGITPLSGASAANALANGMMQSMSGGFNKPHGVVAPGGGIRLNPLPSSGGGSGGSSGPAAPAIPQFSNIWNDPEFQKMFAEGRVTFIGRTPRGARPPGGAIARPSAMPLPVGGGDTVNNITNKNIDSVVFNTTGDAESAVEKFARLRASGKL